VQTCALPICRQRRGRDSNPRTRLTPVTRFPVAPVQPLRHLSIGTRPREYLQAPLAALEHRYLLAGGGDAGDRHVVAADHEVDVDARVVQPPLILLAGREPVRLAEDRKSVV